MDGRDSVLEECKMMMRKYNSQKKWRSVMEECVSVIRVDGVVVMDEWKTQVSR